MPTNNDLAKALAANYLKTGQPNETSYDFEHTLDGERVTVTVEREKGGRRKTGSVRASVGPPGERCPSCNGTGRL